MDRNTAPGCVVDCWQVLPGQYLRIQAGRIESHTYWDLSYQDIVRLRPPSLSTSISGALPGTSSTDPLASQSVDDPRSDDEMVLGVRERLVDAVRARLVADVPVGIYLSGGIDSASIAGIAAHLVRTEGKCMGSVAVGDSGEGTEPIRCFTIAFDSSSGLDESGEQMIAAWLGMWAIVLQ